MRIAVLMLAVILAGCSRPAREALPDVVLAPAPTTPPSIVERGVAPAPRQIRDTPDRRSRMEGWRNGSDPILRDLATGHIKAGDDIEPLVRQNPHYFVLRFGDFVVMERYHGAEGGTRLIAKHGAVCIAHTSDCLYRERFIYDKWPD